MERKFEEELDDLKQRLLNMGAKAERNIGDAIRALVGRNPDQARDVMGRDSEIDRAEIEVDEECISLLALRQPVARDLRFITTAMKIVKDLERIGDIAVDIAERALDLMKEPPLKDLQDLSRMAEASQRMLKDALDAFVRLDAGLAREVIDHDDVVDDLQRKIFRELVEIMVDDRSAVSQGTLLASVTKYLERTGDHSSNIAEMVVFMVEGEDIRHLGKLEPPSEEA